jgi:hypothetical protein
MNDCHSEGFARRTSRCHPEHTQHCHPERSEGSHFLTIIKQTIFIKYMFTNHIIEVYIKHIRFRRIQIRIHINIGKPVER